MKRSTQKTLRRFWKARLAMIAKAQRFKNDAYGIVEEAVALQRFPETGTVTISNFTKLKNDAFGVISNSINLGKDADLIWEEAVHALCGDIGMEWKNWNSEALSSECHLETGEVFKP